MATQCVIRKRGFYYTDQHYLVETDPSENTHKIIEVFDDAEVGQKVYRHILLKSLREPELELYKFDCKFTQEFDAFIIEKLGKSYSQTLYKTYKPPAELSDDDLLEFAYRTGWLPYVLLSFDDTKPMYAVWITEQQAYLTWETDIANDIPILVGENGSDIEEYAFSVGFYNSLINALSCKLVLDGTPEELSDSPKLLMQFLELPHTGISLNAESKKISLRWMPTDTTIQQHFHTLNNLLKKPFYELHPIRPDQIQHVFENPTVKIV